MMSAGPMLSVDFGTSTTVAVVRWPDGRVRPLLFDGAPLLESGVAAGADGTLLVGADARRVGRTRLARYEPHLKQRIADNRLRLDDHEVTVDKLIAAVYGRVATEAVRTLGGPPRTVVLTHPARWDAPRRAVLHAAARRAGLAEPVLVPEPAAAAAYLAALLGGRVHTGAQVLVYDLGGGTFDAAVLRRGPAGGFDQVAGETRTDLGGLDVDAALVDWIGHQHAGDETWQQLAGPVDSAARRSWLLLWQDIRAAKESLSRRESTAVHLPGMERDLTVARDVLDRAAAPVVEETIEVTLGVLRAARVAPGQLLALFAVGGSSRLPLVPVALQHGLGVAPTVTEQPELVVAEGGLYAALAGAPRPPVHLYRPGAGGTVGRLPAGAPAHRPVAPSGPHPRWPGTRGRF